MTLLDSLKENNSIGLKKEAKTWEEAIEACMQPLLDKGTVQRKYVDAIIERTKELGPFYILAPGLAMPHERPEMGVNKSSFSFITLKEPVSFPDGQEVDILIGNPAKAEKVLGWKRDISFTELVERMVKNDMEKVQKEIKSESL